MTRKKSFLAFLLLISLSVFVLLFVLFLYSILHEAGHALVGLLFGQSLTEFDIGFRDLRAHVNMTGGNLSQFQLAIRSVAGVSLPLVIWALFIQRVPRKASFILESLKLISSMTVVNTLLPWIILPVFFMINIGPSDDVANFLRYSRVPPLLLSLLAMILYASGWLLFLSKIDGFRREFFLFRTANHETLLSGAHKTIPEMAGIMTICLLAVLVSNTSASKVPPNRFSPPPDFKPVAQLDLSSQAYLAKTLAHFSLDKSAYIGVFISVQHINTAYFDLSVTGTDGYHSVVLHGEGYNADQDGGLWEKNLPPGMYSLILTSNPSPGTASVYLKIP